MAVHAAYIAAEQSPPDPIGKQHAGLNLQGGGYNNEKPPRPCREQSYGRAMPASQEQTISRELNMVN